MLVLLLLLMIEYENLFRSRKTRCLSGVDCFLRLGRRIAESKFQLKQLPKISSIVLRPVIPLNIAEGNGKFSTIDRARFLEIARGSALECAACLDVLAVRKLVSC